MKKIIAIVVAGIFVITCCGSIVFGEPDDPENPNKPPRAPVIIGQTGEWDKEVYIYSFYAVDPDGDEVFYEITWEKIGSANVVACSPDDPKEPWLGPYDSGEEIETTKKCYEPGEYEVSVRAKDIHDNVGQATIIQVTYKESWILQLPFFSNLFEKYPNIFSLLTKIF